MTVTRIPPFYDRAFDAAESVDTLTCPECHLTQSFPHDDLPPVREILECPYCELGSRIPALQSQAGMDDPIDPPPHDDRS